MTIDNTTRRIHDLFISNKVGTEADWNQWLDTHGFHPLIDTPVPPKGFAYAPAGEHGEPQPIDMELRHILGGLHDYLTELSETVENIPEDFDCTPATEKDIRSVARDLDFAVNTLERTLTYMGWTPGMKPETIGAEA